MTDSTFVVLGICGSLRAGSYNMSALRAAQKLVPEGMRVEIADISQIPLYNEDVHSQGMPAPAKAFRESIRTADAILFSTPEYNYSVPGVLKNAIDWASRGPDQPFAGKAAAIMGASMGTLGTARAQYHLRQIGVFLDLHFINKPEVMIASAKERFDEQGTLIHESTRGLITRQLTALRDWALQLRK